MRLVAPSCGSRTSFLPHAARLSPAPAERPVRVREVQARSASDASAAASSRAAPVGAAPAPSPLRPGDSLFATDDRPIILFDGICNLCNGGVNFVLDWDSAGQLRFAALQSPAGRELLRRAGRAPDDISSIVLVEAGGAYVRSEAVLRIGWRLGLPLPALATLAAFFPAGLRNAAYDQVAANRYNLFGRTDSCRLSDPRFEERFISS